MQPLEQEWNPSGYNWNVVARVGVNVTSSPGTAAPAASTRADGPPSPAALKSSCLVCHGDDVIGQQRLTRPQWDAEINKMTGWGAKVSDQDRSALLDYLAARFGPRRP
jgi:mono/diheme cytochrome c family protein